MRYLLNFDRSRWLLLTMLTLLMGISPAWAQKALPYSYGFEDNNLATDGWTTQNPSGLNNSEFGINSSAKKTGSYGFRFSSYNDNGESTQYLISPELNAPTGIIMTFEYAASSTSTSGEKFKVGYSTTDADISSFTFGEEHSTRSMSWTTCEETFPAGTKYVAIYYYPKYQYRLYIDDITFENNNPYKTPKAFAATGVTATTATFGWTAGNDETAWQIAYSTSEGFDADAATKVDVTTNPYTLEGLTAETTYYARIRADYGGGNYSSWSDEVSFKPTNAIPTTVNDGSQKNSYVPFYGSYVDTNGTMSQFITPSASLTAIQGRQITELTFYAEGSTIDFGTARFNVFMKECSETTFESTTFDWTDMDQVASNTSVNITDGKMVITLDSPFDYTDGNLMIGFSLTATGSWKSTSWYGISSTGSAIYNYSSSKSTANFLPKITFTSLPGVPVAVKKPKNLAASETAATTATLGWTDGEEGLSAWQIAYSTDADFNPESEGTTVDADANPYTLTDLTASTTYYAYVRAKKGNDYSLWSNKVEFTTLAAGPVMELSTTSINFGMVSDADAQAQTFTVTNTGGADLTNLSITCDNAAFTITDGEGNALPQTIAVGQTLTIKVTMNTVGQQSGTITISGDGIEAQTTHVGGYMLDNTKIAETFTAAVPNHWTEYAYRSGYYSTYNWTYSADGAYNTNENSTLTTPKVTVSEGESLTIYGKLKSNTTSGYITVEGSEDNGETWTAYTKKLDYTAFNSTTGEFQLITLSDVPTTVNKLRFKCYYAYLNTINGFTYAADPVLALYSNEECTSAIDTEVNKSFGFVTEDQSQTYYIKNNGTGQIDLTANTVEGFSVNIADAALTEGESTAVTITMPATEGQHNAAIVVTAKNHDTNEVLGTFTVNATGMLRDANKFYQQFAATAIPAGWTADGSWNYSEANGAYTQSWYLSSNARLKTPLLTIAEGETIAVEAKGLSTDNTSYQHLQLQYSTDGTNWTNLGNELTLDPSNWNTFMVTWPAELEPGKYYIGMLASQADIRMFYGGVQNLEPIINFAAADYNFGMISTATTTNAYTINNEGTAALANLSITCDNDNFTVAVADDANEIAVGGQATFTVTLNTTALGAQSGTITISGDGITTKTFNVSGYVADDTQIYTNFPTAPENWENSGWTFSATGATAGYNSNATLTSPKITVAEGQKLAISARLQSNNSTYFVRVEGYNTETSEWTLLKNMTNDVLNSSTFTVVEISDIPTTVNRIRLVGKYVIVNGLNGFTLNANDPKFAVFSDADCTAAINAATATNAWGFVNEDKVATYYIKNTGTGTMTLAATDAPEGFTAELGVTALAAGESTSLTIGMKNDAENNEGYHTGNVVLTATDSESNVLGTFTIASSGVVVGSNTDINFTELTAFPAGWEATNWSVTANQKATVSYTNGTLTTGTYTVAEGETMILEAARNSSYSYATIALNYSYSADGGNTWSQAKAITPASTSKELIAISDIPAGDVLIRFTGTYVDIFRIYGYTAVAKANMALDKTAIDFGMQTAEAEETITVTNNGTAALTNLQVATTTDNYTAAADKTTLAVGESATITVTQLFDAANGLATLSDVLTISADGLADKTVNLSGKTRDASKQYIDFADGTIPATFVETGSWTASSQYATTSSNETSMVTMPLTVAAGEKISFDAKNPYSGSLKVRYSLNGGISWSEYVDYSSQMNSSSFTTLTLDLENAEAVTAVVEFRGRYYVQLDNIYGGTLNATAPMITVKKNGNAVANGSTEEFGAISAQATATYTIKNVGNGTLTITSPVTTTGQASAEVSATSLANGESATLTVTLPAEAPYGVKDGAVTLQTSLGDFVINYTANVLNPNALDEQFANGHPAGWYMGSAWSVSSQEATQESNTVSDLITEQLVVTGTDDALTFQAARNSNYSQPKMTVSYSTDRLNWTEVDLSDVTLTTSYQTITINGLEAGSYYLKIRGSRIKVDNFLGWEKVNNTRDLYVTATSFPATTEKGSEAVISATVTSLIADEQGVYAKLFIDDEEEGEPTEAQDITLNGTQTFSFTYAIPENKTAQVKIYFSDGTEAFATAVNDMKVNYSFNEEEAPEAVSAGTFDITLNRVFAEGFNTLCLPFDIEATEIHSDAIVYDFTGYNSLTNSLEFSKVTELEAGKPYIVYVPELIESKTFTEKTIPLTAVEAGSKDFSSVCFQGSYAPMEAGSLAGCYGLTTAGKIAKASATVTMKGFRGYFSGVPAGARAFFIGEDSTTGIQTLTVEESAVEGTYNLQGQKVSNVKQRGIYIINGKKQVVK